MLPSFTHKRLIVVSVFALCLVIAAVARFGLVRGAGSSPQPTGGDAEYSAMSPTATYTVTSKGDPASEGVNRRARATDARFARRSVRQAHPQARTRSVLHPA